MSIRGAGAGPRLRVPYASPLLAYAAALVVLLALGVYVRTLLPGTGFWDTAEAQTVPHTLSIFHPTGFPTYTLLGFVWSQLPIGEVAWRMNLLSAVCMSLAAGLVTLSAGHLIDERHRPLAAAAAAVAGLAFAFAPEPWENATRADVHAINALFVTLVIWLLLCWRAARRGGSPHADRWLAGAALAFGVGLGGHPLVGLLAFGIVAWLLLLDPNLWRRWRLVAACAGLLAIGLLTYAYIPLRAAVDPEPPLFYARPDTLERLRYLVFAEQFGSLFAEFARPLANFGGKWRAAEGLLQQQLFGPGWLLAAVGAATLAVRSVAAFVFLVLIVITNVAYSMNFRDGDIDRYYIPTIAVACMLLGVAVAFIAAACGRAAAQASRYLAGIRGRRRLATVAGATALGLALLMPGLSLATHYRSHDQSDNREADAWVASVHEALPPNAVVVSWWSYSTPLWYHRWVLGARPDITIIDERNVLDDGYRTMGGAIRAHIAHRPVYVIPPHWERDEVLASWRVEIVPTYRGYAELVLIEGPRR